MRDTRLATGGAVTVTVKGVLVTDPRTAVMLQFPAATGVSTPALLIVQTPVLLLIQVVGVTALEVPLEY